MTTNPYPHESDYLARNLIIQKGQNMTTNPKENKHSKTPWRRIKNSLYYTGDSDFHGTEYMKVCGFNKSEDCEFALKAVNLHEELVKAISNLLDAQMDNVSKAFDYAHSVLKKASE